MFGDPHEIPQTFQKRRKVLNLKKFRGRPQANICIWVEVIKDDVTI
jgi:hypothetical protein